MSDEKRECWQVGDVVRHVGAEAEWMVDAVHAPERYDVTCVQTDGHHATGKVVLATPLKRTELVRRAQKPTGPVSAEGRPIAVGDRGYDIARNAVTVLAIGLDGDTDYLLTRRDDGVPGGGPCREWLVRLSSGFTHSTPPESGAQFSPGGSPVDGPSDAAGSSPRGAADSPGLSFPEYPEHPAYAISSPSPRAPDPGPREQLAAFQAAVEEHLVPRLPRGCRVVCDVTPGRGANAHVVFILDANGAAVLDRLYIGFATRRMLDVMLDDLAKALMLRATGERRS